MRIARWWRIVRKLGPQILSGTLLVLAVVAAVLVPVWDRGVRARSLENYEGRMLALVESGSADVRKEPADLEGDLEFLSSTAAVRGIMRAVSGGGVDGQDPSTLEQWRDRLESNFAAYLRTHSKAHRVRLVGVADGGRELVGVERLGQAIRNRTPDAVLGAAGKPFLQQTVRHRRMLLSQIRLQRSSGELKRPYVPVVQASLPIYAASGEPFGMLVVDWMLTEAHARLGRLGSGEIDVYLMNSSGDFLIHPEPDKGYGFELGARHRWQDLFTPAAGGHDADRNEELARFRGPRGVVHVVSRKFVFGDPELKRSLTLAVGVEDRWIEAEVAEARRSLFLGLAAISVIAALGLWVLVAGAARRDELNAMLERQVEERTQELEDASSLQRAILSHAGYAIVATDANGIIKAFNPAAEKLLGYSAKDLVGAARAAIFHDARQVIDRARALSEVLGRKIEPGNDFFIAKVREESMYEEDWNYLRKDGSRVPVLTNVTALRDGAGEITGMLGIALDRTEHERQQQVLVRAKEEADAANRAKSAFLANMSHEIRTPMNAVLGMLQLLGRTELTERQSDYVVKANSAARSLVGVIDDILDISKIEAGKLTLETEMFRVDELLDEVANMLNTSLEGKPVEFLFRVGMTVPAKLEGDVLRLKQVLVNLLGNAFKFTDEGEVILSVEVAEHDDEGMAVRFEVADTGIGMSPEHQQRVFDSFTQAEAGTSRRFGGTGLGLAISRSLVELMGGELWVESDLGVGSTFGFTLELGRSRQAATPTSDTLQLLATELRSLRILLVDDQPTARTVLTEMLESLGWSVEACSSGFEAVERLRTGTADGRPCDLALVDWQMPELDGWQTAGALRDVDGFRTLPIVAMIPACCQEELAQRQDHDASRLDSVLVKPMTPSALLRCVARIFADGAADRETARARGQIGDGRALAGLRLLVVEDNTVNRQVAEQLLRGEGATVEAVASGRRALDRIRRPPAVDAVLMDIQMPGLDGLETTRRIRRQLGETSLPILAMTANSLQSDRDAALAAGMDDHVGKPVEIGRLVQMILLHCGRDSGGVRRSGPPDSGPFDEPEGFSLRKAAQQLGNDTVLLGELAGRFVSDLDGEADEIADGFGAGRYRETAARLHTLRGVAATLGADALASAAADLELAARESCSPGPDRLEAFGCHCERARRVLAEVQKDVAAGIGAPKARCGNDSPKVDVAPKMRSLESLLSDHNMRAVDVHAEIRTLLPELGAELSSELEQAMDRLDFTVARDRLHQLMQSAQLVRSVAPESH